MAKYNQTEFASLCGIKKNELSVQISRGKVVVESGLIDEDHVVNNAFKIRWQDKRGIKNAPVVPQPQHKRAPVDQEGKPAMDDIPDEPGGNLRSLELQQKKLDVFKRAEEIKNLKVRNEKLTGVVIPTEMVRILFAQHSKSITTTFVQGCDNLLSVLQQTKEFSQVEVAELRRQLKQIVNEAVNKAVDNSKKQIGNIVTEYSDRRGQGERK